ncbi:taste receptor type 2 member 4-like [Phyllobates terribilis]|uniref:taste receptor type 2 member 4-like n=1 Tax=Phyllobates terribilis TaxID=111132 RepID=UPI003CCB3353
MADSTGGNTNSQNLGLLVPTLIAFCFSFVIHLFIIVNNVNDWWKGRSVTSVDHIVTSLGISRLCIHCANTIYAIVNLFVKLSNVSLAILLWIYDFFFYSNIWLTTLLFTVFCLKISNFRTRLFLYLRGIIIHRTGHLLVASILLAAASCFRSLLIMHSNVIDEGTYNTTMNNVMGCIFINSPMYFIVGTSIPLALYVISSVLLFTSLCHHTVKMKKSSNLSINLETYYSAMKLVSVTFMYNTIYFPLYLVSVFYYSFYCIDLAWLNSFLEFLPVLHSSYLIYRTAKLRSNMFKVLQNVIDFFYERKHETSCSSRR